MTLPWKYTLAFGFGIPLMRWASFQAGVSTEPVSAADYGLSAAFGAIGGYVVGRFRERRGKTN